MKAQKGLQVHLYSFFNLDSRRGGWSTPLSSRISSWRKSVTHCAGGCVGFGADQEGRGEPRPHRGSTP